MDHHDAIGNSRRIRRRLHWPRYLGQRRSHRLQPAELRARGVGLDSAAVPVSHDGRQTLGWNDCRRRPPGSVKQRRAAAYNLHLRKGAAETASFLVPDVECSGSDIIEVSGSPGPRATGRRDGRVAEGGGLLNRYTLKRCIGGSNPPLSASPLHFELLACSPSLLNGSRRAVFLQSTVL